jgi:hypothetical protein
MGYSSALKNDVGSYINYTPKWSLISAHFFRTSISHYMLNKTQNPIRGGSDWVYVVYCYTLYWEH